MASCRIVTLQDGVKTAINDDGTVNKLYTEALEIFDQEKALEIWSIVYSPEFTIQTSLTPETASLDDVLRFMNNEPIGREEGFPMMSEQEVLETQSAIDNLMGVGSLSELVDKLNSVFRPNGFVEINVKKAVESGFYTQAEVEALTVPQIQTFINKLESKLLEGEKYAQVIEGTSDVRDMSRPKNFMGMHPTLSEKEALTFILENGEESLSDTVFSTVLDDVVSDSTSPKPSFSNRNGEIKNRTLLNKRLLDKVSEYIAIPKVYFDGQGFTADNISRYITIKNTILDNIDTQAVRVDNRYLQNIHYKVWEDNLPSVIKVLKGVESTMVNSNIDIIGISGIASNRQAVLEIMDALEQMVLATSMNNIIQFSAVMDTYLPTSSNTYYTTDIPVKYIGLNIVRADTNLNDNSLFENGLMRVSDNLFQVIDMSVTTEQMYEEVYRRLIEGETVGIDGALFTSNEPLLVANKEQTMEDIRSFINSRDLGDVDNSLVDTERYSLLQVIFDHTPLQRQEVSLPREQNAEYLKTDFVTDFYNYQLQEKLKNSDIYNKVLKDFSITDTDITYTGIGNDVDIRGIKYEQELRDYANIRKFGGALKNLNPTPTTINEDVRALNYPNTVEPITTPYVSFSDNRVYSTKNPQTYVKVGNDVFRKIATSVDGEIYKLIHINNDSTYFDVNLNFESEATNAFRDFYANQENLDMSVLDSPILETPNGLRQVEGQDSFSTQGILALNNAQEAINVGFQMLTDVKQETRDNYDACQ